MYLFSGISTGIARGMARLINCLQRVVRHRGPERSLREWERWLEAGVSDLRY